MIRMRNKFSPDARQRRDDGASSQNMAGEMPHEVQAPIARGGDDAVPSQPDSGAEKRQALLKRLDEFRMLRRDVSGKIAEQLSSIPEDIRLSQEKISELQKAVDSYTSILHSLRTIDDDSWDPDSFSRELASAIKMAENARIEMIKISARISMFGRESEAAEASPAHSSLITDFCSLSPMQILKFSFLFLLPVILALLGMSLLIGVFMFITFRT